MIASVRGVLAVAAIDETDRPIAEVNLTVTARPSPDGWQLQVARMAMPEHAETAILPDIEAAARQILAALYPDGPVT